MCRVCHVKRWAEGATNSGIKIAGRNINNLRYADDTPLMAESKEELKNLLMSVKEESEKASLKLDIKKPISWLQSPSAVILECKKRKSVTASASFPPIYHKVMGPDAIILGF